MARLSKNQRSSNPPVSSRPSTSRRRTNHLRNFTRSDVYEYQSHKARRAHVSLALDKDEAREHGAASDDDTDSNMRKPRLIGEDVEDEDIPSEDDEELDSDAAFEESDEERFAGFSFPKVRFSSSLLYNAHALCNKSRSKTTRKGPAKGEDSDSPEIDDNDDDNSMDSEEFGDTINVLDVFDGHADDSSEEALPANHIHAESQSSGLRANTDVNEKNDTDAEEDAREEEEPDSMLSADEDVNPSALEGLEKFVSSLETSKKRKVDSNATNNPLPRKRRVIEERTAVGIEGEFTAVASGTSVLSLSD